MSTSTQASSRPAGGGSGRGRWRRRLGHWLVGIGFLLALGFLLRNPILSSMVRGRLERLTGGEVRVVRARFEGLVGVRIDAIELRAPGWPGDGGDVLRVAGLEASLRIGSLLAGDFGFDRITVDLVRIRIAESRADPNVLNISALSPPSDPDAADDEPVEPPKGIRGIGTIVIQRLDIETGVADAAGDWFPDGGGSFQARIEPLDVEGRSHEFQLASLENDRTVAIAKGILDARSGGFELRTDDIELKQGTTLALSTNARTVVEAMDIEGVIREATVRWRPGDTPTARLRVDDLSFMPPEDDVFTSQWVRFREGIIQPDTPPLPRLKLDRGLIELDGDLLRISGEGGRLSRNEAPESLPSTAVAAEFRARLVATARPEDVSLADWGKSLLESMPFELNIGIDRFVRTPAESTTPVDLPLPVAEALELLTAESWDLVASAQLRRGDLDGDPDPDAEVISSARLEILDGRGMYREFLYPLHAVNAILDVEGDQIRVRTLEGLGPSGAVVRLEGDIDGLGDDAGVDLRLSSDDIPLDDDLLAALPETTRRGLRNLFDKTAADRLREAGMLPDQASIDAAATALPTLERSLHEAISSEDRVAARRLTAEVARIRTRMANGPFEIGGGGAIDLRIHRPRIQGYPVAVEGPIDLRAVGGVFSRFPYPLFVERGRILLEDLAVILEDPGLEVATIAGGRGLISGRVDLPRDGQGGRDVLPELDLRVDGDALGPLLFAAIPPQFDGRPSPESIPGWPGEVWAEAIEPIMDMGLAGTIDFDVRISTDEAGDARFEVRGLLHDGTATPRETASREVADAGLVWPSNFTLDDVQAALEVDDDGLELTSFTGRRGAGTVHARATYDFGAEIGRGIARLRDLEIEDYLLDLIPNDTVEDARTLWNRWQPTGRFHADLHWTRREGRSDLTLEAEPLWAEIDTTLGRTRVLAERGRLLFGDGVIEVDDLAVSFGIEGRDDGALRLSGDYGYGETSGVHRLVGVLDDGRFEAPAVDEVMRLAVGDAFATWWRAREPEGRFRGRFELVTGTETAIEAELAPSTFSLLSRIEDPTSRGGGRILDDGVVRIDDRRVAIGPLDLLAENGSRLGLEIRVDDVERPEVAARFRIGLPSSDVPEAGFLPPPFSSFLAAEDLSATEIDATGELVARFADDADGTVPSDPGIPDYYRAEGTLDFASLRWTLGGATIESTSPARPIHMELDAVDGVPTWFDLAAELPVVRVAGRVVDGVVLRGELASERSSMPGAIRIVSTDGRLGDGTVRLDAMVSPATGRYEVDVAVSDVPLDALATAATDDRATPSDATGDVTRLPGRLDGRVRVQGDPDDPASRVGRGRVELREARLADGGALALLQIGQLMPPIADEMATAGANLWIDGTTVRLEDVRLEAETVRLTGAGTMRLEDWEWSIRLVPRGSLPAIADLVSAISGTLGALDISGTPDKPVVTFTPLPPLVPLPKWPQPPSNAPDTVDPPAPATVADDSVETRS